MSVNLFDVTQGGATAMEPAWRQQGRGRGRGQGRGQALPDLALTQQRGSLHSSARLDGAKGSKTSVPGTASAPLPSKGKPASDGATMGTLTPRTVFFSNQNNFPVLILCSHSGNL